MNRPHVFSGRFKSLWKSARLLPDSLSVATFHRPLICPNFGKTFYEILEAASSFGWRNFDMTMLQLYREGLITEESAILYCTSKGVVSRGLDKIKKERGENTSGLTGLTLDSDYGRS